MVDQSVDACELAPYAAIHYSSNENKENSNS